MNELGHYLKIRYGLAPHEPTDAQLAKIVADLQAITKRTGEEPTLEQTEAIVRKYCPTFRTYKYAADVNLELRRQIAMLAAQSQIKR